MKTLGIVLIHEYRLLSAAAVLDVFGTVNALCEEAGKPPLFRILLLAPRENLEECALSFPDFEVGATGDAPRQDLLFIPAIKAGRVQAALEANQPLLPWLREQRAGGAEIASYCTGAFLLGATGLLNGLPATTHIDACDDFARFFPDIRIVSEKVVTGCEGLYTSGGATSGFHLMLYLIARYSGNEMAVRVAKIFAIDMDRGQQAYFAGGLPGRRHSDELVALTQEKIAAKFQDAETIEEIIRDVPASRRNIARRFKQVTGITPIEYLQKTRIEAAKRLLEQTNQQMTEIMLGCGYNDPKAFRKVFRKSVGMTPTDYRGKFQMRF